MLFGIQQIGPLCSTYATHETLMKQLPICGRRAERNYPSKQNVFVAAEAAEELKSYSAKEAKIEKS